MCNLGEGIRERAVLENTADIIVNIMQQKKASFEEAFASIFGSENDKNDIKAFVDKRIALRK